MFIKPKLRTVIIVSLLAVGLIPSAVIGILALHSGGKELEKKAGDQLVALRDVKKEQINRYFVEHQEDMDVLVETVKTLWSQVFEKLVAVRDMKKTQIQRYFRYRLDLMTDVQENLRFTEGVPAFAEAFSEGLDSPAYEAVYKDRFPGLKAFRDLFDIYDVFLIDPKGNVVFTVAKEADWGTNLVTGPLKDSGLAKAFEGGKGGVTLVDFEHYEPSDEPAAFLSTPLRANNGGLIGVAAFQVPIADINAIMGERSGLGKTGEAFLVGPDKLMRSDSYLDPENRTVVTSFKNPARGMVDTKASRSALAGNTGSDIISDYHGNFVLCAWTPVRLGKITWALMAKIDVTEAFTAKRTGADKDFFAHFQEIHGDDDLLLVEPDGHCFYTVAHQSDYETNLVNGRYKDSNLGRLVRQVLQTRKFGFADFEPYEPSDNKPAAFVAQPVVDKEGEVELVVAMRLSLDTVNEIMGMRAGMGETGGAYLVGPDHLMRSDGFLDHMSMTVVESFRKMKRVESPTVTKALEGKSGQEVIHFKIDGKDQSILSNYAPIDVFGVRWALLAEVDEDEALASVSSLRSFMLITLAVTIVGVVGLALAIARMVRRKLTVETGQLHTASQQLKTASQQQLSGTSEQTAATGQISTTMDELAATARQIAERCQQVAQQADSAAARCQEGSDAVRQGQTVTSEIKGQIDKIVQHMTDLGDKTQQINMAVDVIAELSEQTTILSYNAAIEAAAAGEAGQTFSVVADQVGKLADRAKQAAKDVRGIVDEVQKSTSTTIMATEDGLKAADRGLEAQDQASQKMARVAEEIRSTLDAAREIEMSSKQQSTAAAQVKEGMEQIVGTAKESEASAKQTLGTADLLVTTASNLDNI